MPMMRITDRARGTALISAVLSVSIWGCNPKQELLAPQQPTIITPGSVTSATAADYFYAGALSRWKAAMNGGGNNPEALRNQEALFNVDVRSSETVSQRVT